jgi:hypothetical protein
LKLARLVKFFGLAALAVGPLASAQTQAKRTQAIRAGVVIIESAHKSGVAGNQPLSVAPYAWFNLNSDRWVKPASWNIYNPNAPARVTKDIQVRWGKITGTIPQGTPPKSVADTTAPAVGTALTKRNAAYWEVFLSNTTDKSLAQYDVLLLAPGNYASLNPLEREKLRGFVDRGGLLWIDPGALQGGNTGTDQANNYPYAFSVVARPNGVLRSDYTQPLLSTPNPLSSDELNLLNGSYDATLPTNMIMRSASAGAYEGFVGGIAAEFAKYQPVTMVDNQPSIAIARIGEGMIVVTSRGAAIKLNKPYGGTLSSNVQVFSGAEPVFDRDTYAGAKLAVNMISLLTEFRQGNGSSRKTGGNPIDVGAPLLRNFAGAGFTDYQPTVYKGILYAIVNNQIVAYDANPYRDLDGDGNPDDGVQDLVAGGAEDIIWRSNTVSGIGTPVCAEVPNADTANGIPKNQVLVSDQAGHVYAFNATPKTATGQFDQTPTLWNSAYDVAAPSGAETANSVTLHEGLAYVSDNIGGGIGGSKRGRIWVIDMALGAAMSSTQRWSIGGASPFMQLPELTAAPTVGYIPIADNSGGTDRVAYVPFAPNSGIPSAGVISVWLGARGERPSDYEPKAGGVGSALVVTTRASQQGGLPVFMPPVGSPMGVKVSLIDAAGNVMGLNGRPGLFGGKGMSDLFDGAPTHLGGGVRSFPFRGGSQTLPTQVAGVRVDYWIDWGDTSGTLAQVERGRIQLPDRPGQGRRRILGPVALSPAGTIWINSQQPVVTNNPGGITANEGRDRGGVYAFREEGRGLFKMVTRWEMFRQHYIQRNGGSRVLYAPNFFDMDPFRLMIFEMTNGGLKFNGNLTNYRLVGAPVIRNGQVFVTARADQTIQGIPFLLPSTILMSFRAEPEIAQVKVGDLPEGSQILQMDVARSSNFDVPETPSVLAGANYSYNANTGTVRFENLATVQKGVIQNSLSLSQPIIVRRPGQPDELIEPDAAVVTTSGVTGRGARWTPLLWYSVFQGLDCANTNMLTGIQEGQAPNGPFAAGDTVYVGGRSFTPSVLSGGGPQPIGMLMAIRSDVSPTDPYAFSLDAAAEANSRPAMAKVGFSGLSRPWITQYSQFRITANDTTIPGKSTFDVNAGYLWPQMRGVRDMSDLAVRYNQTTLTNGAAKSTRVSGVIGGDGSLVAWGDAGMYAFSRTDFLVADEGRVAQFDPAGNLLWSTTASGSAGATGSNTTGTVKPVVRPTRAYRLAGGQILMVDTGANRIALVDKSGAETRSITQFQLDKTVVPAGFQGNEPLSLNAPRDVLSFTSYEQPGTSKLVTKGDGVPNGAYEYWVHYLVADSGNARLVQLIDRYRWDQTRGVVGPVVTVDGVPQLGVLFWHSPANVSGKSFAYTSISRSWLGSGATGRYVYVAGIGGSLPSRVDTGLDANPTAAQLGTRESNSGGGVVIFDPLNPSGTQVFNRLALPAIGPNVFFNEGTGTFNSPAYAASTKLIGNVASVTTRLVPLGSNSAIAIMIADSSGVYEALYGESPEPSEELAVRWMLTNTAYQYTRRVGANISGTNLPLRATFARRLDSGDVLIVNGFYGPRRDRVIIGGEVVQLDGTPNAGGTITAPNLGFSSNSIMFELPPIEGARGLVIPVFADRR